MNRCGTYDGLNDHKSAGTEVCPDCKIANAIYHRQLRRRANLGLHKQGTPADGPSWKRRPDLGDMAQVGPVLDAGLRASA